MRILIVEDDPSLAEAISFNLNSAKILTSIAETGPDAIALLDNAARLRHPYDAVVLDLTLPGLDGMDVLRMMRSKKDATPVLVLTARSTLAERVDGLENGADDFLAKPCETVELIARLRAIARRHATADEVHRTTFGNLSYNTSTGDFDVDGATMVLPRRSHVILEVLFRRRGKPVTKEYLANMDLDGTSLESIDTQMYRIRRRIKDAGATVSIRTLKGTGFMLEEVSPQDQD